MEYIASELNTLLVPNKTFINIEDVDMSKKFNHCSIIIYCADYDTKESSSLSIHCDCVYPINNARFVTSLNEQVINIPVVIYSLGD